MIEFTYKTVKLCVRNISHGFAYKESCLYSIHMLLRINLGEYQASKFDALSGYNHTIRL